MEFPLSVLQGLKQNKAKASEEVQVSKKSNLNIQQYNETNEHCPVGCDPSRTTTAISKSGRKDVGNFVNVYYRGSGKLKKEVPLAVKQETFWREFDELEERSKRRNRNRSQPDRRTDQIDPRTVFA